MNIKLGGENYYIYNAGREHSPECDVVVFVHGTACEHSIWANQSRYFAHHNYNVAAVDLPGHFKSGGELLKSIEAMAKWLVELVGKLQDDCRLKDRGDAGVHLVGHSMGSLIVLEAAGRVANLKSLSMLGFSYPMAVTPQLLSAAKDEPLKSYEMMTQWSHASALGGEPLPGFWSPGMSLRLMKNSDAGAVFADLNACNNYKHAEAALAKVQCPILFLCGEADKMTSAKSVAGFAAKNKNSQVVVLNNCGHNMMSEMPDEVLFELRDFVGSNKTA